MMNVDTSAVIARLQLRTVNQLLLGQTLLFLLGS